MFYPLSGPRVDAGARTAPHRLCSWVAAIGAAAATAIFAHAAPHAAPADPAVAVFTQAQPATPAGRIDELHFARLAGLGLSPAPLCTDAVFVRRAFLDVIGTLPTAAEARDFLRA